MIKDSELILNDDGSIYHIHLRPEQVADKVITVGDPGRVERVARHFNNIEFKVHNREFYTVTGSYQGERITAISTGIGPDNIDIVINELDILRRFDLKTGELLDKVKPYFIIRMGTSGSAQEDIPVGAIVASEYALGMDNLMQYYDYKEPEIPFAKALREHIRKYFGDKIHPTIVPCSTEVINKIAPEIVRGITVTAPGFYGPQGRHVSLKPKFPDLQSYLGKFNHDGHRVTNFEMESSAIYGLSYMLGHKPLSLNVIIANRIKGTYSEDYTKDVDRMIEYGLGFVKNL